MRLFRVLAVFFWVVLFGAAQGASAVATPPAAPPTTPAAPVGVAAAPAAKSIPAVFTGVGRIVAVGDIHGDYEKFVAVLKLCRITDAQGHWSAGKTHLVQTGDVLDRGPDSKKVMDQLMQLEGQAEKAGGHVHALIGNHEYMTMMGDLRYVSDGELAAFGDGPRATPVGRDPQATFPRYRAAFAPNGPYGRWIASHNALVRVNTTIFMHGGLSPRFIQRDIVQLNDAIRAELRGERDAKTGVGSDPEGPLWFRGLAEPMQPPLLDTYLSALQASQQARRIVMGHTIQEGGITLRAVDRLALIDVGMSRMTIGAPPTCLEIVSEPGTAKERVTILK